MHIRFIVRIAAFSEGTGREYCFLVSTPNRTLSMCARSEAARSAWIHDIRTLMNDVFEVIKKQNDQ